MSSKNRLIQLFGLPENETIFEDFGCALIDNILRHGRMFVSEYHICFYSTIMGITTKKVIEIDSIKSIEKKTMLGFIQSAIEIVTEYKTFFFSSFSKRDAAYNLLYAVWKGEPYQDEENIEEEMDDIDQNTDSQYQVESAEVEILNLEENIGQDQGTEILKIILPISCEQFYEKFWSDNASFTFLDHLKKSQGGTNLQMTQWQDNEEGNGKTREINGTIKVKGVPFKDSSRLYKVHTYKKLDDNQGIEIRQMCKTLDVPYSANFQVEEQWTVNPLQDNPQKCKLTIVGWIVIIKSFVWQQKAKVKGIEGVKEDCNLWMESAKQHLQKLLKQQGKKNNNIEQYEKANIMDQTQLLVNDINFHDQQIKQIKSYRQASQELEEEKQQQDREIDQIKDEDQENDVQHRNSSNKNYQINQQQKQYFTNKGFNLFLKIIGTFYIYYNQNKNLNQNFINLYLVYLIYRKVVYINNFTNIINFKIVKIKQIKNYMKYIKQYLLQFGNDLSFMQINKIQIIQQQENQGVQTQNLLLKQYILFQQKQTFQSLLNNVIIIENLDTKYFLYNYIYKRTIQFQINQIPYQQINKLCTTVNLQIYLVFLLILLFFLNMLYFNKQNCILDEKLTRLEQLISKRL